MSRVPLTRLLEKDVSQVLCELLRLMGGIAGIYDPAGRLVAGVETGCELGEASILQDGKVIGRVRGVRAEPAAAILGFMAEQEAARKRLQNDVLDRESELHLLTEMAERMAEAQDVAEIAAIVVDEATATIESTGASVMLVEEKTGRLEIVAAFGKKFAQRPVLKPGVGIVGEVLLTGHGEIVNDAPADARFVPGSYKISSLICAPIMVKDRIIGAVNVSSAKPMNYKPSDMRLITLLGGQAGLAIETARKLESLRAAITPETMTAPSEPFSIGLAAGSLEIPPEPPPPSKAAPAEQAACDAARELGLPESLMNCFGKEHGFPLEPGDACHERMAVLFSDIRSFSEHAGSMNPRQNVGFLTQYVQCIRPVVPKHGGFVAQWLGDGQLILFPESRTGEADNALKAAVEIQKTVGDFSRKREDALQLPVAAGMGLCVGPVTFGVIGFDSGLISTVFGEAVTAATRLERLTKRMGIKIAVSDRFVSSLKNRSLFTFREVDLVEFPGMDRSFSVLEVLNADPDGVRAAKCQCLSAFQEGVAQYRAREFEKALRIFEKLKSLTPFDRVVDVYMARSLALLRTPPGKAWVGITKITE